MAVEQWRRMVLRKLCAWSWHCQAVLLWLIRRPELRGYSVPYPCVEDTKHYLREHHKEITSNLLSSLVELRTKMGYQLSFLTKLHILKGIMKTGTSNKIKQAATKEVSAPGPWLPAGLPLGPRGGLPRSKPELLELAHTLRVPGAATLTVEQLQRACRETLEFMKARSQPGAEPKVPSGSVPLTKAVPLATPPVPPPPPTCRECNTQMVVRKKNSVLGMRSLPVVRVRLESGVQSVLEPRGHQADPRGRSSPRGTAALTRAFDDAEWTSDEHVVREHLVDLSEGGCSHDVCAAGPVSGSGEQHDVEAGEMTADDIMEMDML